MNHVNFSGCNWEPILHGKDDGCWLMADGMQDPWMCVSDPAISASAELLERGSLLYNLRFLAWKV